MNALVMMYVYFDKNGDIKSISPAPEDFLDKEFSAATFTLSEVEDFLTGKKNPFDYQVKKSTSLAGASFKLLRKVVAITHTRTLDNYLTKIDERKEGKTPLIRVMNDTEQKVFSLEATKEFLAMATSGNEDYEEIVSDFTLNGTSTIYITQKNNPYSLLHSFSFLPSNLFEREKLYFPYADTYTNTSAYTKKLLTGYTYRERRPL